MGSATWQPATDTQLAEWSAELRDDPAFYEMYAGNESHTSNWGKFVVRGADGLVIERRISDRHESYRISCGQMPAGALLTIWAATGDKRGTLYANFLIVECDPAAPLGQIAEAYTGCYLRGRVRILAEAHTATTAPRLLNWWVEAEGRHSARLAVHLGREIQRRGVKAPAPLAEEETSR